MIDTLIQGDVYIVKLRGIPIRARFINAERIGATKYSRERTRYRFNNLQTGREITLKSRARIIQKEEQAETRV